MKNKTAFAVLLTLSSLALVSCGGTSEPASPASSEPAQSTKTSKQTSSKTETSQAPKKTVEVTSISLMDSNNKAYIRVSGTVENFEDGEFTWAWGLMDRASGEFADGSETPEPEDFQVVSFNDSNRFTVDYCLTNITTIRSGTLYRIYGGTPETYDDIPFQSNQFGAKDATRKYYLRQDAENSLVFDNIQPISFSKASVVEMSQDELPAGITHSGFYVKFGGANSKGLTMEQLKALDDAGNIAGNFQRVIGGSYEIHEHTAEERFYAIEGNDVFFYCYISFIEPTEGWMVHFDAVSGNSGANMQFTTVLNGETLYSFDGASFRVYADSSASGEENYWGSLGVYRVD